MIFLESERKLVQDILYPIKMDFFDSIKIFYTLDNITCIGKENGNKHQSR
jgi:hypothetical protein